MYRVDYHDCIYKYAIEKETDKCVIYKNGLRENKVSQWQHWFHELKEAIDFALERSQRNVDGIKRNLSDAVRRRENLIFDCAKLQIENIHNEITKQLEEKKLSDDLYTCESCGQKFEYNSDTCGADDEGNYFCSECYKELAPVMRKEYEELKKRGEI